MQLPADSTRTKTNWITPTYYTPKPLWTAPHMHAKVFGSCIIEHLGFELVIPCFYGCVSMRSEISKIYLTLQRIAASGEFHDILEAEVPQEYQGRLYAHLGSRRRRSCCHQSHSPLIIIMYNDHTIFKIKGYKCVINNYTL